METRRGARGLSHQGRFSRAPEVLLDGSGSMASSITGTDRSQHAASRNSLSTLTSTDAQHPFKLVWEATENCERLQRGFEKMEEQCKRLRSHQEQIDSLMEEIRSDCENLEKSKENVQQCTGIPAAGALSLRQKNSKQLKEASAQAEEAVQQDGMEVGFANEAGFPLKTCLAPSCTVEDLVHLREKTHHCRGSWKSTGRHWRNCSFRGSCWSKRGVMLPWLWTPYS
ncbi:flagellar attachment zone protein 1-like [Corvus kubaryi]|uniref:flagellar attachment zone protein 1-like n=1 Tax=Corvus kubaryi TaxID=68294 RepID=UPI001C03A5D2|nr:flagellar attachment zone protein 1-like [Corvus kubaryi]